MGEGRGRAGGDGWPVEPDAAGEVEDLGGGGRRRLPSRSCSSVS